MQCGARAKSRQAAADVGRYSAVELFGRGAVLCLEQRITPFRVLSRLPPLTGSGIPMPDVSAQRDFPDPLGFFLPSGLGLAVLRADLL